LNKRKKNNLWTVASNEWLTRVLGIINSKRSSNIFFDLITMVAQKNNIFIEKTASVLFETANALLLCETQ